MDALMAAKLAGNSVVMSGAVLADRWAGQWAAAMVDLTAALMVA